MVQQSMTINNQLIEFEKLCIYTLTVFDTGFQFYEGKEGRGEIIRKFEDRLSCYPELVRDINTKIREIDQNIYDCEFANKNKGFEPFEIYFNLNLESFNKSIFSEETQELLSFTKTFDTLSAMIMIESYGIGVLRTKWDFTGIKTDSDKAIDIAFFLNQDIDKNIFTEFILKNIIKKVSPTPKINLRFKHLDESLTEVLFISRDDLRSYIQNMGKEKFYKGIAQFLWLYPSNFQMDTRFAKRAEKQNLSLLEENFFIISRPASIGIFSNANEIYIDRRIKLIETLYCQFYLLKRFDYQLREVMRLDDSNTQHDLQRSIDDIITIQQESQVLTEFYRNSHIASYSEYRMFIDAGNNAFSLSRLYDSVKERIQYSQTIVMEKLGRIRNKFLDHLQLVAMVFAAIPLAKEIINPFIFGLSLFLIGSNATVEDLQKQWPVWNSLLNIGLTILIFIFFRVLFLGRKKNL